MTFGEILGLLSKAPLGGYNPQAAAVLADLTLDQMDLMFRPAKAEPPDDDATTERDYHRLHAIANGWPEWLEEKLWRQRHPPDAP